MEWMQNKKHHLFRFYLHFISVFNAAFILDLTNTLFISRFTIKNSIVRLSRLSTANLFYTCSLSLVLSPVGVHLTTLFSGEKLPTMS